MLNIFDLSYINHFYFYENKLFNGYVNENTNSLLIKNGVISQRIYGSGNKHYYSTLDNNINLFLHREDGPAIESRNGNKSWFYNGEYIECNSQSDFEKIIKLNVFR